MQIYLNCFFLTKIMIELSENQIFIYKINQKNLKLPLLHLPRWSGWNYVASLPDKELIAKSIKKISLKLSEETSLIEKFKGIKFGKLEIVTDKSLQHNKIGFNGSCYYQKSGLKNSELKKVYNFLYEHFYYFTHQSSSKNSENMAFWNRL